MKGPTGSWLFLIQKDKHKRSNLDVPFYAKNVQQRRLAQEAAERMLALLDGKEPDNCLLTAETVVKIQ